MRLAILALSAAAISGCSWLGGGGSQQAHYTPGCYPASGGGHGYQQAGYQHHYGYAQGAGCAGGIYGAQSAGAGYGTDAFNMAADKVMPHKDMAARPLITLKRVMRQFKPDIRAVVMPQAVTHQQAQQH
jgi:hypothetical protein